MRRLTDLPGPERHPHLSPDGRQLIYDAVSGASRPIAAGHPNDWLGLARIGEILMVEEAALSQLKPAATSSPTPPSS